MMHFVGINGSCCVLDHSTALQGSTGAGETCGNDMDFGVKHDPIAGAIARPIDLQSSNNLCATAAA